MNDRVNTLATSVGYGQALPQAERQRVLRNTYWLLALSLLPTVLGAWLGVATGITRSLSGGIGLMAGASHRVVTPSVPVDHPEITARTLGTSGPAAAAPLVVSSLIRRCGSAELGRWAA